MLQEPQGPPGQSWVLGCWVLTMAGRDWRSGQRRDGEAALTLTCGRASLVVEKLEGDEKLIHRLRGERRMCSGSGNTHRPQEKLGTQAYHTGMWSPG